MELVNRNSPKRIERSNSEHEALDIILTLLEKWEAERSQGQALIKGDASGPH